MPLERTAGLNFPLKRNRWCGLRADRRDKNKRYWGIGPDTAYFFVRFRLTDAADIFVSSNPRYYISKSLTILISPLSHHLKTIKRKKEPEKHRLGASQALKSADDGFVPEWIPDIAGPLTAELVGQNKFIRTGLGTGNVRQSK